MLPMPGGASFAIRILYSPAGEPSQYLPLLPWVRGARPALPFCGCGTHSTVIPFAGWESLSSLRAAQCESGRFLSSAAGCRQSNRVSEERESNERSPDQKKGHPAITSTVDGVAIAFN
jgi:hypothetical protein